MELFKKRQTAIIVFVVVVIAFSLIGCHRSLGKAVRQTEQAFFDKTLLASYDAHTTPAEQLENCLKLSNRLLSVINGSEALADDYAAILAARQGLSDALDAGDISDIYDANAALVFAVEAADEKVRAGVTLPESSDDYDAILSDFYSAQRVAEQSPYNEFVDDFITGTVQRFPTNILRVLSFTPLPEKFE